MVMEVPQPLSLLVELKQKLPSELHDLLDRRDGAALLLRELPKAFPPEKIAGPGLEQRAWELAGLYYRNQRQVHQALSIFAALYDHMLAAQEITSQRVHKGMPLVWMSDLYSIIGFAIHTKRYLMLTLCEDAVAMNGEVSPEASGVYFRLVWGHGLPNLELKRFAGEAYRLWRQNPDDGMFPEWILQELGQAWITELPTPAEAGVYTANTRYVRYLMSKLGEPTGKTLERLADYVLSCMPGCVTTRRQRSGSTDYDIVCSMMGFDVDFRSELGRYFVCECKDWDRAADFTTLAKFCRVLDSTKSRFGIVFSKRGISGEGKTADAEREQLKVFQDRGMVIVAVNEADFQEVANGGNFIQLLRAKYERVRLDLRSSQDGYHKGS
jgi:hypothetical protein